MKENDKTIRKKDLCEKEKIKGVIREMRKEGGQTVKDAVLTPATPDFLVLRDMGEISTVNKRSRREAT